MYRRKEQRTQKDSRWVHNWEDSAKKQERKRYTTKEGTEDRIRCCQMTRQKDRKKDKTHDTQPCTIKEG
jgi:hypothetical protein